MIARSDLESSSVDEDEDRQVLALNLLFVLITLKFRSSTEFQNHRIISKKKIENPDRQRGRDNVHEQAVLRVVFVLECLGLLRTRTEIKDQKSTYSRQRSKIKDQLTGMRNVSVNGMQAAPKCLAECVKGAHFSTISGF